jgi:uncharacterized membrane protein
LAVYFLVSLTAFAVAVRKREVARSDVYFVAVIWIVGLTLLLSTALVSRNLVGTDIHDEYRLSSEVISLHRWNDVEGALYNSVISITLLVPALSIVSGLNALTVHQLVLPVVYSVAPVILYKIYRTMINPRSAFLSTLLFVFFPHFYINMAQLGRQEVAEVILLLLIWVLLSRRKNSTSRGIIIIFLTLGFVTAHYSLVFIFLFFIVFSSILSRIRKWTPLVNSRGLLLILVAAFAWYTFVAGGAAVFSLTRAFSSVTGGLSSDFFAPSSTPNDVLLAVGIVPGMTGILHYLNRLTQYLLQVFLIIGFVAFALKSKKTLAERQMLPLMAAAFVFLAAAIILPFFAFTLQFSRVYHITLLLVAPCFVYGIAQLDYMITGLRSLMHKLTHSRPRFVKKRVSMKHVIAATLLLSYFLFTSGWVWATTLDVPTSIILDSQRMKNSSDPNLLQHYYTSFTTDTDVSGAQWLRLYRATDKPVCSDQAVRYGVLTSYGGFPRSGNNSVYLIPRQCHFSKSYVYLSEYNNVWMVGYSEQEGASRGRFSMSDMWFELNLKNRVFSDGAAIYA